MPDVLERAGVASVGDLAELRGIRECLHWFTREKQWINEQHLHLCRIPAPTFLETQRAEWFAAQFRAFGCQVEIDPAGNVIAFLEPDAGEGTLVALTAHLDTVLAPRNRDDVTVGPDGRLHGPGVSDNGAGLAALLAIARALQSSTRIEGRRRSLVLIANVGEEGEGNLNGMRHLFRPAGLASRIEAWVVLDGPATDHITGQALASQRFELLFSGPGGQSWSDHGMGNPVHAISRAITLFLDQVNSGSNGASPRCSYNFGLIEGGASINSIPVQARAKLDLRSECQVRVEELAAQVRAAVERVLEQENERAVGGRLTAKVREIGSRPGGRLPEDSRLLKFVQAVDQHLGIRSHLDCSSTDANIPLSLGLAAISIGAGGQGGGAHTGQEWYSPEGRDLGLKRILLTLALLLRDAGDAGADE